MGGSTPEALPPPPPSCFGFAGQASPGAAALADAPLPACHPVWAGLKAAEVGLTPRGPLPAPGACHLMQEAPPPHALGSCQHQTHIAATSSSLVSSRGASPGGTPPHRPPPHPRRRPKTPSDKNPHSGPVGAPVASSSMRSVKPQTVPPPLLREGGDPVGHGPRLFSSSPGGWAEPSSSRGGEVAVQQGAGSGGGASKQSNKGGPHSGAPSALLGWGGEESHAGP